MDSDSECTPPEISAAANEASTSLLPQKSLVIYEKAYDPFQKWRSTSNAKSFSENVILAYLSELSKKVKSSTLWSHYSMLKSTLRLKQNVDIGNYPKVRAYLKRQNEGYTPKKSRVLEKEQILQFIKEAPDQKFLFTKVVLIFGVAGAMRRDELYKLKISDIEDLRTIIVVHVNDTKNKISRKFTITEHLEIYRKYALLRPQNYPETKFFINYQGGKCTRQVVGINKIGKVPSEVAKYLKLPNAEEYTGHSLRRSSATLLVEAGGDLLTLKKHGGWKSSTVAENYIENSLNKKIEVANKILTIESNSTTMTTTNVMAKSTECTKAQFGNVTNCTITINNYNNCCNKEH